MDCLAHLQAPKDSGEGVHHRLNDLPVHLPGALVGLDADVIMMDVAPRHGYLEVVGP